MKGYDNYFGYVWLVLVVKDVPANTDVRDAGSIPGSERSLRGGHGNPLQYSCSENPMDRRAWWSTVHGVTQSWTRLKQLSSSSMVGGTEQRKI